MRRLFVLLCFGLFVAHIALAWASDGKDLDVNLFDDKLLINGYAARYRNESKEVLLARIKDETLDPFRTSAAVRVFKDKIIPDLIAPEKPFMEKILLRRLNRTDSPFLKVEIMHTLCRLDRYKYFDGMVPALIVKLEHYNSAVNEFAYEYIDDIIKTGNNRAREARIIFNSLRKSLFLSRRRLANITEPNAQLKQKFNLLRWAIKVLGNQEINKLPREVINLL